MRDYYQLIKLLRSQLSRSSGRRLSKEMLLNALGRNFGGNIELMDRIRTVFMQQCFGAVPPDDLPTAKALIVENFLDPHARHLMVLTKNGSALKLMFSQGLLDATRTTVLIGSQFDDDMTELYLVTQINEVKLAMAEGSTIILLNHDNIYESLYDVLNQRHVVKIDPKTGKMKRMLRLAIGARSQLCQVADGFKICVVVEQQHAYDHLDLPLLNRFEKQVLTCETALAIPQRQMADELHSWCDEVMEECGIQSHQAIFGGFHDGTVASLVLSVSAELPAVAEASLETVLDECKVRLARVALPVAAMQSELLQLVHPGYFEDHASIVPALESLFGDHGGDASRDDDEGFEICPEISALLLTQSPVQHFDISESGRLSTPLVTSVVRLAELSTERALVDCISAFFAVDTGVPALLILQCDPILSRQSLINHARHLCDQCRVAAAKASAPRHVLCVVHLPPAVGRQRDYCLDFEVGWQNIFCDDLRPEANDCPASLQQMMESSAFELCEGGELRLEAMLRATFTSALCSCAFPAEGTHDDDHAVGATLPNALATRLRVVGLLVKTEAFMGFCSHMVLALLEQRQDLRGSGLHEHVELVCTGKVCGGSTRDSLMLALELLVTGCWTRVLARLDCNGNLLLAETQPELWFALAGGDAAGALGAPGIGGAISFGDRVEVESTGNHGPFMAGFPFSWRVASSLEAEGARGLAEVMGDPVLGLDAACAELIGAEAHRLVGADPHGSMMVAYLTDYVHLCAPKYAFDFATHKQLIAAVLRATHPQAFVSPGALHASARAHGNEARLFLYSSLVEHASTADASLGRVILKCMCAESEALGSVAGGGMPTECMARLAALDGAVLEVVAEHFWEKLETRRSTVFSRASWLTRFAMVEADIRALLAMVHLESAAAAAWRGLQCVQNLFHEVSSAEAALEATEAVASRTVRSRIACPPPLGCGAIHCTLAADTDAAVLKFLLGELPRTAIGTPLRCLDCGHEYNCAPSANDGCRTQVLPLYITTKPGVRVRSHADVGVARERRSGHLAYGRMDDGYLLDEQEIIEVEQYSAGFKAAALKFRGGWVSLISEKGTALLEPLEVAYTSADPAVDLIAFAAAARGACSTTEPTLADFKAVCEGLVTSGCTPTVTCGFLRRYAADLIFGASAPPELPLVAELVAVVAGRPWSLSPLQADLSLRRSLVRGLQRAGGIAALNALADASDESAQLLLQKLEDDLEFDGAAALAKTHDEPAAAVGDCLGVSKLKTLLANTAHPAEGAALFVGLEADAAGLVGRAEVERQLTARGCSLTEAELDDVIAAADSHGGGRASAAHLKDFAETLREIMLLRRELSAGAKSGGALQSVAPDAADARAVSGIANGDGKHTSSSALGGLQSLARCRVALRAYAAELVQLLDKEPDEARGHWERQSDVLQALLKGPASEAQVFALKCVGARGGNDALAAIIRLPPELVPWLPVDRSSPVPDTSLVDPFPDLGPAYLPLAQVVRRCAGGQQDGADPLQKMLRQSEYAKDTTLTNRMLLGAFFRATVVEIDGCTEGGVAALRKLLLERFQSSNEEIGVAQWFVAGCQWPGPAGNRGLAQLQAAVCLVLSVLSKPSSWHYQLLCKPDDQGVAKSFFPTMPDSEMAAVIRASGLSACSQSLHAPKL